MVLVESEIVAVVSLASVVIALGALIGLRVILQSRQHNRAAHGFGGFKHIHQRVESSIIEFRKELAAYHQRRIILDVHTPEYFNTFQLAGWDQFKQLLEDLLYAQSTLERLMESGEFEEADLLVNFLMGRLPETDVARANRLFRSLAHLADWRKSASNMVLQLTQALEQAAQTTQDLGIRRPSKRKPTLLSINELQDILPK